MYAMHITAETAPFIGEFFNNGVIPEVKEYKTFFLFGDKHEKNRIVTEETFVMNYDWQVVRHSTLFKFA